MSPVYQFTVSPDFPTKRMSSWFILNTWLQKATDLHIHLELYPDFASQRQAIHDDAVDLIYANPFDASMLVREKGFVPLLRPQDKSDECLVAVKQGSPIQAVEDLAPGCRVASTEDPDVNLVGMMLLEPADLDRHNTQPVSVDSYPLVAKALFNDDADVGFFLEDAYSELSNLVRKELRELVRSQISDITHVLLSGPRLTEHRERLIQTLSAMPGEPKTAAMLEELGFSRWQVVDREDTEFMIDLMDTLVS